MTAQPHDPLPDTALCDVIHLGGQAAVVVPMPDFLRLRALEQQASVQELEDAEDAAALGQWRSRDAACATVDTPADQVRERLGPTS